MPRIFRSELHIVHILTKFEHMGLYISPTVCNLMVCWALCRGGTVLYMFLWWPSCVKVPSKSILRVVWDMATLEILEVHPCPSRVSQILTAALM